MTQPINKPSDDEDDASNSEYNESEVLHDQTHPVHVSREHEPNSDDTISVNDDEEEVEKDGNVSPQHIEEEEMRPSRIRKARVLDSEEEEGEQMEINIEEQDVEM